MTLSIAKSAKASEQWLGDGKPHPGRRMTELEFEQWVDATTRAEWVDGEIVMMAPASLDHAEFAMWLQTVLRLFVEKHEAGAVYGTDVSVRLPKQRRRRLPDVLFVSSARASILQATVINGAPDLIIGIVSPDSSVRDWREKFIEYEKAGVREYWVIDRLTRRVAANELTKAGKYRAIREDKGRLCSAVLKGFYLRPEWVLRERTMPIMPILRELGV